MTRLSCLGFALSLFACNTSHTGSDASNGSDGPVCAACLGASVSWGTDGGLVCTRDSSSLSACRTYIHERVGVACDPPDLSCTNELPACGSIAVGDVAAALAHPDVVAALASAPVLYGQDRRPVDGVVTYIDVDGSRIEVGPDCSDGSCTVPAGVRALEQLLVDIDAQQVQRDMCATVFGG